MRVAVILASFCLFNGISFANGPLQGVLQPDSERATGFGLSALEDNPAGLGFGQSLEFNYTYVDSENGSPHEGHAWHLGLGFFDSYYTALGLQLLDHQNQNMWKISWGNAFKLGQNLSLGFAMHHFYDDSDSPYGGITTWDLGMQLRPIRWFSAGVAVTDLNKPSKRTTLESGESVRFTADRAWQAGFAVRPGIDNFTLGLSARLPDESAEENPSLNAGLNWRIWKGFSLVGRYEVTEKSDVVAHTVMLGLMNVGRFGVGAFGYMPEITSAHADMGGAVAVRYRAENPAWPLFETKKVVEFPIDDLSELEPPAWLESEYTPKFVETVMDLDEIASREDVELVVIGLGENEISWAQVEELRQAILRVREAGKRVYVYLPSADSKLYAVATAGDRIYMPPTATLYLTGASLQHVYFADLFQKLGIHADFLAIGEYKSAPEAFTQSAPSEAARTVDRSLMDGIYKRLQDAIEQGRPLSRPEIAELIDHGPYSAHAAQKAHLIDEVIQYDAFEDIARKELGQNFGFIDWPERQRPQDERWGTLPTIGLLYALGTIHDQESKLQTLSGELNTGALTFVRTVRALAADNTVKAVVLRIDSPGGSVSAADLMWHELRQLAQKKPLIVSMGGTAASGGYYIATAGEEIYAEPSTITGSIGIFAGKFDFSGLLAKLGIAVHTEERGQQAEIMSFARGWTDDEKKALREILEDNYELFLERVQTGRDQLSLEKIRALAGGRVWSGEEAFAHGLVDHLGGYREAIAAAAQAARVKLEDCQLKVYGFQETLNLVPAVFAQAGIEPPAAQMRVQLSETLQQLSRMLPFTQALLPFVVLPQERPLAVLPFVTMPD